MTRLQQRAGELLADAMLSVREGDLADFLRAVNVHAAACIAKREGAEAAAEHLYALADGLAVRVPA